MKIRNAIFLLLMSPLAAQAQEVVKGEHFIEVSGRAEQEIEPNEIYVTVRLREFEENKQKVALEKIDADLMAALKNAGIERSRLELTDVGANLGKIGKKDKDAFREKTYQIKLTTAAELEKLIAKMDWVKVDYADITRLHHTDLEKIRMELKVKALQVAKQKAETLMKSIGAEIGKPILVREIDYEPYQAANMRTANVMLNFDGAPPENAIGFRKIRLQAQVTAQFEIK